MSEPRKITCPECDTPNEPKAPFCGNCGYRLRRADTLREGHQSVRPAAVAASLEAATAKSEETQPEQPPVRPRAKRKPDTEPEAPAIDFPPEMLTTINEAITEAEVGNTILEGLEAVDPLTPHVRLETRKPSPSESGLFSPPEEQKANYALLGSIWVVSTAALMLVTFYLTTRSLQPNQAIEIHQGNSKVEIPEGPFLMGLEEQVRAFILLTCHKVADDKSMCEQDKLLKGEFPQKTVVLNTYSIDSHELTNQDYQLCVSAGECDAIDFKECKVHTFQGLQPGMRVPKVIQEAHMPVGCMTRQDATNVCKFRGGHLPSAEEWEKAARGDKGELFPWGDGWFSNYANWSEIDILKTPIAGKLDGFEWSSPPASFPKGKSPYGLYDAGGNMAEWVAGSDALKGTAHGGSWASTPFDLRTTGRIDLNVNSRRADVGARCAY